MTFRVRSMKNIAAGAMLMFLSMLSIEPLFAQPELLLPGDEYLASDLPADPVGDWFVLFLRENTHVLAELPITIRAFQDSCIDDSPGQESGRSIEVPDTDSVVMLVRGIDGLVPGAVVSATYPVDHYDYEFAESLSLDWSNRQLSLRPVRVGDGFRVELVDALQTNVLYITDWTDEGSWALRWAGDLNRDGGLDILLDATHKYSVFTTRLFLSRDSPEGLSYEQIATLTHAAC